MCPQISHEQWLANPDPLDRHIAQMLIGTRAEFSNKLIFIHSWSGNFSRVAYHYQRDLGGWNPPLGAPNADKLAHELAKSSGVETAAAFEVAAGRLDGLPGIWVGGDRKLAAIGVEPETLTEEQISYQQSWR